MQLDAFRGFPGGSDSKESASDAGDLGSSMGRKIPWRREWQTTPVFLPGKFHGHRSLVQWDTVQSMGFQRVKYD